MPYYAQMRAHAAAVYQLMGHAAVGQAALASLTPEAARTLAAALPADLGAASARAAAAKRQLEDSAAAAASMDAFLHSRVVAVLAAAVVQALPYTITPHSNCRAMPLQDG